MKIALSHKGLLPLAALSVIAGAGAGLICGLFRVALSAADALRLAMPAMWSAEPLKGCLIMMGLAAPSRRLSRPSWRASWRRPPRGAAFPISKR